MDFNDLKGRPRGPGGPCADCVLEKLTQVEAALTSGVKLTKRGKDAVLHFLLKARSLTQELMEEYQAFLDADDAYGEMP